MLREGAVRDTGAAAPAYVAGRHIARSTWTG
jgi:hypothetical protein